MDRERFFSLHGNRLIELVDGSLEVLPVPTWLHQLIVKFLIRRIEVASDTSGVVLSAPLPVRLFAGTIREPDVMYFAPGSEPSDPKITVLVLVKSLYQVHASSPQGRLRLASCSQS
jgi:hypothetical protein